ncbi:aminotransferase class V-fold PLP-dependent enzyme [Rhodanobacter sp. Col0626]|uniref:aminotransferase class V-fold PLP-dependent enzyme n=1 Tax=Rhodanobacter sp. Col0626 TaxID=3415679 RepID=UPI003CE8FADA
MTVSRRQVLKTLALAPAAWTVPASLARHAFAKAAPAGGALEFKVRHYETCLDNARWHPLSVGARARVEEYLDYKERVAWTKPDLIDELQKNVKQQFARLIGAETGEIAYVNSTTAGETMFVSSLGLPDNDCNIVTDGLHFEGSLYLYGALQKQGMDVRVVRPDKHWRIDLKDMERVIDHKTRLVAVSQVSFINGFQHDLKALCELAHSRGALVYVDAVQAVGAIPVDVKESGVDAMGSASYKWLMGDFGLGFLYVRQSVIPRLRRTLFGYRQLNAFDYHAFPDDPAGPYPASWSQHDDASGFFEIGTYSNATLAALSHSLPAILALGPATIQRHAQRLIAKVQREVPRLGYPSMTPADAGSPIATFLVKDSVSLDRKLRAAGLDVFVGEGRMRISPSIYNTDDDIERLLEALA